MASPETTRFYEEQWRATETDPESGKRREADGAALRSLRPLAGMRLLEIGPGAGGNTLALAADGAVVVALDLAESALRRVRDRARHEGRRVLLVQGDAACLPFRRATFSRAAVFSVLMFVPPVRAFEELAAVLQPGGRAAIVEAVAGNVLLGAWRRVSRYRGLADWCRAPDVIQAAGERFRVREAEGYYGFLPAAFLPPGIWRRRARAVDAFLIRLFPGQAWQLRLSLERM